MAKWKEASGKLCDQHIPHNRKKIIGLHCQQCDGTECWVRQTNKRSVAEMRLLDGHVVGTTSDKREMITFVEWWGDYNK